MQQSRQRIIETMRERDVKKVNLVMTQEEFAKANGFDDVDNAECDYNDYINNDAPWVIFFDKYGNGRDYAALSVDLEDGDLPKFKLNCWNDEQGASWFWDYDVASLSMVSVYDTMECELRIESEEQTNI